MSENETPVPEPSKPSKLQRIKSAAPAVVFYGTMIGLFGGSMYAGVKVTSMQLETAKLTLEAAKLNKA